jgi:hypothetical protein
VHTSRPYMPGYGIQAVDQGSGLLAWSWAEDKLRASPQYWLATTAAPGQPHVMPVWGIWSEDALWFSSARRSRKVRNLLARPACSVAISDPIDPVVVEGIAGPRNAADERQRFLELMNEKYGVSYGLDFLDGVENFCLQVQPVTAFGLLGRDFTGSPTRWLFEGPA